ncbi:hypothetical protein [Flexibacter flexilis]|uniref:hypothetical protein n=1 Tax=Flexibacter flexilis TaxID=998 RepID=UPI000B8709B5|nr:hypothetical protein [Flexibacter flexilis]
MIGRSAGVASSDLLKWLGYAKVRGKGMGALVQSQFTAHIWREPNISISVAGNCTYHSDVCVL